MNPPQINPYGQAQQPQPGWPSTNLPQQMASMNLTGPPKPAMPPLPPQAANAMPMQQPQQYAFNNNPDAGMAPQNMMAGQISASYMQHPSNNSQFPQQPTNGIQTSALPQMMPPPGITNKTAANQFPPASVAPNSFPPQQQQQQQQPAVAHVGAPSHAGQRPPIPGESVAHQNGHQNGPEFSGMPPALTRSPQPVAVQQLPVQSQQNQQMPPGRPQFQQAPNQNKFPASMTGPSPVGQMSGNVQPSQQFPGMPQLHNQQPQHQMPGMPPMPSMTGQQQQQNPMMASHGMVPSMPSMIRQQQQQNPMMTTHGMVPPMPGQQNQMMNPVTNQMPQQMMSQQQRFQQPPGMPGQFPQGAPMQTRPNFSQQPGVSPMMNQAPGQFPPQLGMGPTSPMQAAPQRRLDPDQMPNPIQVMSENQRSNGGIFATSAVGLVPPLVTTNFTTQDQGNSGPRFIRSTMYSIPATADMIKQSAVPFSLIITPMAKIADQEMAPPIVDFGEIGPIRCVRCKAYMSPNMQFIDAGRRFQCLLCKATTEVPAEYFQHLDHTGQRVDKYERPELVLGTYEFTATKDYCRNNVPPKPPAMIFIIDVSYNNVKSGLVHLLCSQMKRIIRNLPIDQNQSQTAMKVGFITYNNTVQFYNVKSTLAQPQMMVVGDVHEMFMPLLDGFLVDPQESEAVIDLLMDQIPKMYSDTRETETILMPAIQAGLEALKASECAGKLLVFHSSLPIADAPGQLKNRDDRKLLGTEKERTVLTPQNTAYNNLGQDCVGAGCTVDLFVFNNAYIDLATIGQVSRLSGGEVYKYTYFQADIDGERLVADIIKNISRPIAFDAVMRVRTSTGTRPTDFYGHFFMSNTTDLEIAGIDCDKSVAIEIKHDDKLAPEENVYIQVALLYTSCSGQRRLRIMNLALKTCVQLADLFRSCDLDTLILFFAKQGIFKLLEHTPKVFRDNLINRAAQILACYRKHCASPTSAGQLILPECLKLLPLYVSCLLKNDAFSGGSDITLDDRSYVMYFVSTMDLPTSVSFFYPRLIPIHNIDPEDKDIPAPIRCSIDKMTDDGAFILDNGIYMFLWLGIGLSPEFTQSVFGAQCTQQIDTDRCGLPVFDNPLSNRVRGIVESIQKQRTRCMRIALVRQRDKLESVLRHFLIEDRGTNGSESYVDFLCYMHKEIRSLLS